MFGSLDKYFGLLDVRLKNSWVYRGDFVIILLLRVMFPITMIFVWTAIYATTRTSSIAGFSLFSLYSYFLVTAAVSPIRSDIDDMITQDVQSGGIAVFLVRPIAYILDSIVTDFAQVLIGFLTLTIPLLVVVALFAHAQLTPSLIGVFALELIAMYMISGFIGILLGLTALYFTASWGITNVANRIFSFLGGSLLPLSFFPQQFSAAFSLLPFQFLYYVPAATFSGSISTQAALNSLLIAALWIPVLFVLTKIMWHFSKKRINAVGV